MKSFLIISVLFAFANYAMALWHTHLWRQKRTIQHGWWGALYIALAGGVSWITGDAALLIALCCNRQLVFDNLFDHFRGFSVTYHSVTTTSIIDHIENFIFRGNWYAETATYLALLASTIIFHNSFLAWQEQLLRYIVQ